jgi:K+-transporting ATPase, c chain/Potassium-transporting ATPase A subunit
MTTTAAGVLFVVSMVAALALAYRPLGDYMARVFTSERHLRAERVIYRVVGVDPDGEQTWPVYTRSVLAFSAVAVLTVFVAGLMIGRTPEYLGKKIGSREIRLASLYFLTMPVVDTLDDPSTKDTDESKPSLLTQVCSRSKAIGELDGVDGSRPYCTASGVGAALAVFHTGPGYAGPVRRVVTINEECGVIDTPFLADYQGVTVECHRHGEDVSAAQLVLIRGDAPAHPAVPADAVTASASGLDPAISPAYARLQVPRVARERGLPLGRVEELVSDRTARRALGFLGEPAVNVLLLNLDLDRIAPVRR